MNSDQLAAVSMSFLKTHMLAHRLTEDNLIIDEVDGEVIGVSSDGTEVTIGYLWNPKGLTTYLLNNPKPEDW